MSVTMNAMMASFQASSRRRKDKRYMVVSDRRKWWPMTTNELKNSQCRFEDDPREGLDHFKGVDGERCMTTSEAATEVHWLVALKRKKLISSLLHLCASRRAFIQN